MEMTGWKPTVTDDENEHENDLILFRTLANVTLPNVGKRDPVLSIFCFCVEGRFVLIKVGDHIRRYVFRLDSCMFTGSQHRSK